MLVRSQYLWWRGWTVDGEVIVVRKLVWVISGLVLLVGGGVPGPLPASAQPSASAFTVSGTVAGAAGQVRVVLYLWPSQAAVAALEPGQRVPLRALASQMTSSGRYALSVDPAALDMTMGSIVNMQVIASAKGGMDSYSFSRQLAVGNAGRPVLAALAGPTRTAPQTADLRLPRCGSGNHRHYCACPLPSGGVPDHIVFKKNLGEKSVIVGALFSRDRDITAKFSYEQSQSSSLGVGISAGDSYANFSERGTFSVSSSSGVDFPRFHGHTAHLYKTEFRYGKYRWRCDIIQNGVTSQIWGAWQVQANDFGGGATTPELHQSPDARFCVFQEAHSTFHKSTSAAFEFTKGASLSDSIGIDLSAQTGYDRRARLAYTVGNTGRQICGLKGPPGGNNPAPELIVAGAP